MSFQFEQGLADLEQIVAELEAGKIGLQEALERFEHGCKLLRKCHEYLQQAERRIELLTGVDADGNPVCEEFVEDESATLEEKAEARASRRSHKPAPKPETPVSERVVMDDSDEVN